MKKALILLLLCATPARSADYVVVLNDSEKTALLEIIDAAVRAQGLVLATNAAHFAAKIKAADKIVDRKDDPAQEPKQ